MVEKRVTECVSWKSAFPDANGYSMVFTTEESAIKHEVEWLEDALRSLSEVEFALKAIGAPWASIDTGCGLIQSKISSLKRRLSEIKK